MKAVVDNQRGFAMLSVFMLLMLALTLGAATMTFTLLDFKSTQHFATGNQAMAGTEAGIVDVINTINTRGVVNFQNDVITAGLIPTSTTAVNGYSNVTYQLAMASGTNTWTDGILTATGNAALSAQRVIKVGLKRGNLTGGPGALHLSNDAAAGSFAGNSMTIDGNNWLVTDITTNPPAASLDATVASRPAISTRNDTVTTQIVTALAGQGTITGLGSAPSVYTTAAGSTADLQRFVDDIMTNNGAPGGCNRSGGGQDYWIPGPCSGSTPPASQCGVHCVRQTNGNSGGNGGVDLWGSLARPAVTFVTDTSARLNGGAFGAGILIFSRNAVFGGNFNFCGWVLFLNPDSNGITIQGNPSIYGEVLSPLPAFTGGGSISVKYSDNCLSIADGAGVNTNPGNLPHPVTITSWAEQ